MYIRLENPKLGRFVKYEYGRDLFGYLYLDKIRGRERGKLVEQWVLPDLGSLFRVLDLEIYRRESENYVNSAGSQNFL